MSTTPAPNVVGQARKAGRVLTIGWRAFRRVRTQRVAGIVTKIGGAGFTDVTTKTGYVAKAHRQDLTRTRPARRRHAASVRLQPHEWLQAQMDGAICAVYEGRVWELLRAKRGGRSMFTVESSGASALRDWTAPERASTAMQNDLSTEKIVSFPQNSLRPDSELIE